MPTRAERLRTGCHRLGLLLATPFAALLLYGIWATMSVVLATTPPSWEAARGNASSLAGVALATLSSYGFCRLIGWTWAGFIGED